MILKFKLFSSRCMPLPFNFEACKRTPRHAPPIIWVVVVGEYFCRSLSSDPTTSSRYLPEATNPIRMIPSRSVVLDLFESAKLQLDSHCSERDLDFGSLSAAVLKTADASKGTFAALKKIISSRTPFCVLLNAELYMLPPSVWCLNRLILGTSLSSLGRSRNQQRSVSAVFWSALVATRVAF